MTYPTADPGEPEDTKTQNSVAGNNLLRRPIVRIAALFLGITVSCLALYNSTDPFQFLSTSLLFSSSSPPLMNTTSEGNIDVKLEMVLRKASMEDKTVILTTVNQAWLQPHAIVDVFFESFKIGNDTRKLLKHLVIVTMDPKAYKLCLSLHPHCHLLTTPGLNFTTRAEFMTPTYLEMMWTRIDFLATVLKLGYNFVFTDADIVWLQNPFPRFYPDGDFQIACDGYLGNPNNRNNRPNGGFNYVKSNNRTIAFYKFWYSSRKSYPGLHDQDVLNKIKYDPLIDEIGMSMKFLDTTYFGGFCEASKNFNVVCTMHANCCIGMENKIHDLKLVLEDWKSFWALPQRKRASSSPSWRAPKKCRTRS